MRLNIAQTLPRSAVNGPGERFVIWVQGCSFACPGCWNPDTWSFEQRNLHDVDQLIAEVLATEGTEGVTFTGGEPFAQAGALTAVARSVKNTGRSIFVFTGFELDALNWDEARELLSLTDVLVTGRYVEALKTVDLPWRGSSNQQVHFLSDRYGAASMTEAPAVEFYIDEKACLTLTGFPTSALLLD